MGAALNTAIGMGAYILTDRASWLNFQNKTDFAILFEGDSNLFNQYSFIAIRPNGRDFIQLQSAQTLQDWLLSDVARDLINGYTLEGAQLFTYNAER